MKLAIIHDYLNQYGGAERVLERLHDLFPDAPIYTSIYDPRTMPSRYRDWDIRTSFMQRFPGVMRHHQMYLPFYPLAFESFDLGEFDVVLSNSSAWSKGVMTSPNTLHLCYCLTPMRWVWNYREYVQRERFGGTVRLVLPVVMNWLRLWDRVSADGVDQFATISRAVAARVAKYYRRDSVVIYPPVDTASFRPADEHDDYFLVVSRLIPYKRIDIVVEAFNRLGLPLVIIGDGRDRAALQSRAGANIRFLGMIPDAEVKRYFARCRAFIFPGEEDFGITPVEAQAAGRPVIAYAGGGALDTVIDGVTGRLFKPQTADGLAEAIASFDDAGYDPAVIRQNAERFSAGNFDQMLLQFVDRHWETRSPERAVPERVVMR
ncbi:MAG TPA: glycosyltransferase [Chloroflexota bacterium]